MVYTFFPDVIKGKEYNNLVNYLCNVADKIYFMFYEDMMYNDRILEFAQRGHQGNMRKSKYAYWTTEELLERYNEFRHKGHLTAKEKEEKKKQFVLMSVLTNKEDRSRGLAGH